jgi:hypothetical protein
VGQGGALLLAGDAGVLDQNNVYPRSSCRFSRLAGIEYGFYDELRDKTVAWGEVWGNQRTFNQLHIPTGMAVPRPDLSTDSSRPTDPAEAQGANLEFARYGEGTLLYPVFVTRGAYDGRVLLHSRSGVAAGLRNAGKWQGSLYQSSARIERQILDSQRMEF